MPDMLVKLYALPEQQAGLAALREGGVEVRRAIAPETFLIARWVREQFNEYWASECEVAMAHSPAGCFVATEEGKLLGFACYDATLKGFFGPTAVAESARGRGIGKALLLAALHAMHAAGYGYAIIGAVGPPEFYAKAVGATMIEGSAPGIYRGMLRAAKREATAND